GTCSPGASKPGVWHVRFLVRATRPRPRARQRFKVGPSSTTAARTKSASPSSPWFASAFATAEASTFSTSRAAARDVKASTARASGTLRPRMCSATTRALRADVRTHLAWARTVWVSTVAIRVLASLHLRLAIARMTPKQPRRGELAELVADHLLRDEHRHVLPSVVDGDRVPDHLREDRGRARPGPDHP